jgi:C4-dicarboxylate-specific signal transduction histidine kinase
MNTGGTLSVAVATQEETAERALSHGSLRRGRYVCVSVEDSGCGMDEATIAGIFEPFFTTKEVGHGTGLGLSMVYAIVTDLGGAMDVRVRSIEAVGSRSICRGWRSRPLSRMRPNLRLRRPQ